VKIKLLRSQRYSRSSWSCIWIANVSQQHVYCVQTQNYISF